MRYCRLQTLIEQTMLPSDIFVEVDPSYPQASKQLGFLGKVSCEVRNTKTGRKLGDVEDGVYMYSTSDKVAGKVFTTPGRMGWGAIALDEFKRRIDGLFGQNDVMGNVDVQKLAKSTGMTVFASLPEIARTITANTAAPTKGAYPRTLKSVEDKYVNFLKELVAKNYSMMSTKRSGGREIRLSAQPTKPWETAIFANSTQIGTFGPNDADSAAIDNFITGQSKAAPFGKESIKAAMRKLSPFAGMMSKVNFAAIDSITELEKQLTRNKDVPEIHDFLSNLGTIKGDPELMKAFSAYVHEPDVGPAAAVIDDIINMNIVPAAPVTMDPSRFGHVKVYLTIDLEQIAMVYSDLNVKQIDLGLFTPIGFTYTNKAGVEVQATPALPTPKNPINILKPFVSAGSIDTGMTVDNLTSGKFMEMLSGKFMSSKKGIFGAKNMLQIMNRLKDVFDAVHAKSNLKDVVTVVDSDKVERGYHNLEELAKAALSKMAGLVFR